jgi:ElaB/YqjD/DUF883 family membrane-anchored ribosome-binding protein
MAVDRSMNPDDRVGTPDERGAAGASSADRGFSGGSHGAGGPFGGAAGAAPVDARGFDESHDARTDTRDASIRERGGELLEDGRERGEEFLREGRERAGEAADAGRTRLAGKLEEFGGRLAERGREAREHGGVQARAGDAAIRASGALDSSAEYLRSHDMEDMRDDIERQIRERPLMSVGVALGAGFLLARMLRD